MADNEKQYICKYCDTKLKRKQNVCVKCYNKLPLVKELVGICKRIKELAGDTNE